MALHIDDVGLLILAVGLLVGHAVHKHTKAAAGAASKGASSARSPPPRR